MTSTPKPPVLLIALSHMALIYSAQAPLLSALQSSFLLLPAETPNTAFTLLAWPNLKAVILGDADLTRKKHADLRDEVIEYARAGGTVILGCVFTGKVRPSDHASFYKDAWGLPWGGDHYERATFYANPARGNGLRNKRIPASYSQKAVSLRGVETEDRVYLTTAESKSESLGGLGWALDSALTPVAFTKVGDGFLGYIGDVNSEEGSTDVMLAMINAN